MAAYVPLVVAILDAGLACTATLPAVGEMHASLHIHGTASSILDTVFVCRRSAAPVQASALTEALQADGRAMLAAGAPLAEGDLRCQAAGHGARLAVASLAPEWGADQPLAERMIRTQTCLTRLAAELRLDATVRQILAALTAASAAGGRRAVSL